MSPSHSFDSNSAKRIADAVRWVEGYMDDEGEVKHPKYPTHDLDPLPDETDENEVGVYYPAMVYVSFGTWPQGSSKSFTVTGYTSNTEDEPRTKSVSASNPFGEAKGPGIIGDCGGSWYLIAASCPDGDGNDPSSSATASLYT